MSVPCKPLIYPEQRMLLSYSLVFQYIGNGSYMRFLYRGKISYFTLKMVL